jgi:hypothetical protein
VAEENEDSEEFRISSDMKMRDLNDLCNIECRIGILIGNLFKNINLECRE